MYIYNIYIHIYIQEKNIYICIYIYIVLYIYIQIYIYIYNLGIKRKKAILGCLQPLNIIMYGTCASEVVIHVTHHLQSQWWRHFSVHFLLGGFHTTMPGNGRDGNQNILVSVYLICFTPTIQRDMAHRDMQNVEMRDESWNRQWIGNIIPWELTNWNHQAVMILSQLWPEIPIINGYNSWFLWGYTFHRWGD